MVDLEEVEVESLLNIPDSQEECRNWLEPGSGKCAFSVPPFVSMFGANGREEK